MSEFRDRLKQAAVFAGVGRGTQAEICASLNLPRQTVNRWFMGGTANGEIAHRIARAWGVNAEWLQTGNGDMRAPANDLPDDEQELLRHYRSASAPARENIRTLARALRKSIVIIATALPGFMDSKDADAAMLHKTSCRALVDSACGHITDCISKLVSALRNLRQHFAKLVQYKKINRAPA